MTDTYNGIWIKGEVEIGLSLATLLQKRETDLNHNKIFEMIDRMAVSGYKIDLSPHNIILNDDKLSLINQDDENYNPKNSFYITDKEHLKAFLVFEYNLELDTTNFRKGKVSKDGEELDCVLSLDSGKPRMFALVPFVHNPGTRAFQELIISINR